MTILDYLKKSVEIVKTVDDTHEVYSDAVEYTLPDMLVLLEKGYPVLTDVKAIAANYPDVNAIKDIPDYHHIDNVFGDGFLHMSNDDYVKAFRRKEVDSDLRSIVIEQIERNTKFDDGFKAWYKWLMSRDDKPYVV